MERRKEKKKRRKRVRLAVHACGYRQKKSKQNSGEKERCVGREENMKRKCTPYRSALQQSLYIIAPRM